jgi:hypothetical protein
VSTGLARRLKKLEAVTNRAHDERARRIAEGNCPDCGFEHGYLPTNGGAWHCVICGNRFTLQPGPACMQRCPVEAGGGCNSMQRPLPADPGHEQWFADRRTRDAIADIRESMSPEHRALVVAWTRVHCPNGEPVSLPGEGWHTLLERRKPPALVRAVWVLINHHVATHLSVSLPPAVAEVYLTDRDAWPALPCDGCRYLMPTRARIRADDTYEHLEGVYAGPCPVCGLDNHPEEPEGV